MTVEELMDKLRKLPEDAEVKLATGTIGYEPKYLNTVKPQVSGLGIKEVWLCELNNWFKDTIKSLKRGD